MFLYSDKVFAISLFGVLRMEKAGIYTSYVRSAQPDKNPLQHLPAYPTV
jgi:hypothetical protein